MIKRKYFSAAVIAMLIMLWLLIADKFDNWFSKISVPQDAERKRTTTESWFYLFLWVSHTVHDCIHRMYAGTLFVCITLELPTHIIHCPHQSTLESYRYSIPLNLLELQTHIIHFPHQSSLESYRYSIPLYHPGTSNAYYSLSASIFLRKLTKME